MTPSLPEIPGLTKGRSHSIVGGGSTSYSGWVGFTSGFSSATEMARMRILSLSGRVMLFAPAGRSMGYANR